MKKKQFRFLEIKNKSLKRDLVNCVRKEINQAVSTH